VRPESSERRISEGIDQRKEDKQLDEKAGSIML